MAHALNWTAKRAAAARGAVAREVAAGRLPPPAACAVCGGSDHLLHHHPDYNWPLFVVPLCRAHHQQVHYGHIVEPVTGRLYEPSPRQVARATALDTAGRFVAESVVASGGATTNLTAHVNEVVREHIGGRLKPLARLHWFSRQTVLVKHCRDSGALAHARPVTGAPWVRTDLPLAQAFPLAGMPAASDAA